MPERLSIPVDLADPESIRAKLPEVSRVVAEKRVVAAEAKKDLEQWVELESWLKAIAGLAGAEGSTVAEGSSAGEGTTAAKSGSAAEPRAAAKTNRAGSVQVVTGILEREGREMRTPEVRALAPTGIKPDTISWALWRAAKDGKIRKIAKGRYAPFGPDEDGK